MQIERKVGESELDYHRRLIYGKLEDKTLADCDYTELAELVYGKPYSSDVARRMMYGSKYTLGLIDSAAINGVTDEDVILDIDSRLVELQKEKQRFFDQRREYNKRIAQEGRAEHLEGIIRDAANNLQNTVGLVFDHSIRDDLDFDDETEAVVVFSDWHYGLVADNVFNTYNTDICRLRVNNVVDKMMQRIRLHKCNRLHIVVLGDLWHGAIYVGTRVASEELVCDQIMQVSEILAQAIVKLSSVVDSVVVYDTYGNHARTVPNKKENVHRDNMERLVPWWLKWRLKDFDNIKIMEDTGNEFVFVDTCGHSICASHGDLDGVKSSPRLLYTLFQKTYGIDIEYIILGDKHHIEGFNELGITAEICGSLCGSDDYANSKRLYSNPSQMLLIVNKAVGVDAEYRIKCDL